MLKLNSKLRDRLGTHGEIPHQEINTPLFIVGCMRSGTTYLVDQITSHPQLLKIGTELNQVWRDIGGANTMGNCEYRSSKDANGYYTYQMANYFFQFIRESRSFKRHLMRASILWSRGLGRISYDWNNIIPVNKSPHLTNKIEYVNAVFPKSKFLFIVRDIYAHSASMKVHFDVNHKKKSTLFLYPDDSNSCWSYTHKADFGESTQHKLSYPPNFQLIPRMWIKLNKLAFESLRNLDTNQYLVISYEDLVLNQGEIFKNIFEFLSLDPKHSHHESRIMRSKISYINTTTIGDPLKKWEKTLSQNEIAAIDQTINDYVEDYSKIQEELSILKS